MADKRISELTELGNIASNDFIPLVDTSVNETKKVSAETLSNFVQNNIVIPPSTTNEIEQGNSSVEVIDTGTDGRVVVTADGSEIARFTAAGVAIGTDTLDAEDFLKVLTLQPDNLFLVTGLNTAHQSCRFAQITRMLAMLIYGLPLLTAAVRAL